MRSNTPTRRVKELFAAMPPRKGEKRTVQKCGDCGHFFGRRFIPYGLGHGLTVDACLCQLTGRRPSKTVSERKP